MNTTPRSPTSINTASYPSEEQQLIREKSENFVGREFVFAAINKFLHRCDRISDSEVLASLRASAVATFIESALPQGNRGYFTIVSAPSSGKSVILAEYIKMWHLDTEEVITSLTGDSPLFCCAFAPDGVTIVAGDALGRMHFLTWKAHDSIFSQEDDRNG